MTKENKENNENLENVEKTNNGIFVEIADDVKSAFSAVKNGFFGFFQNANEKSGEVYRQAKENISGKFNFAKKSLMLTIIGFVVKEFLNSLSESIFKSDEKEAEQANQQDFAKEQFDSVAGEVIAAISGDQKARAQAAVKVSDLGIALGSALLAKNASKFLGDDSAKKIFGKHSANVVGSNKRGEALEIAA